MATQITTTIKEWEKANHERKLCEAEQKRCEDTIKSFMKERRWDKYIDEETDTSISLTTTSREEIDKAQLKIVLSPNQYALVRKMYTDEKLVILTKDMKDKMNKFIKRDVL